MKRPLKVLSASLSLFLLGQMLLVSAQAAETPSTNTGSSKLVEWSNEEVKAYYDPQVDWSLPIPADKSSVSPSPTSTPSTSSGTGGSSAPIIVNQVSGGGFGWDDLLLYHLIFNTVSPYSSNSWGSNHRSYYYRSNTPYVNKTYQPSSFTNRSTTKTPTTSSGSGTFTSNKSSTTTKSGTTGSSVISSNSSGSTSSSSSKSTSTSSGSIGGKSSGFSSSSSSSSGG